MIILINHCNNDSTNGCRPGHACGLPTIPSPDLLLTVMQRLQVVSCEWKMHLTTLDQFNLRFQDVTCSDPKPCFQPGCDPYLSFFRQKISFLINYRPESCSLDIIIESTEYIYSKQPAGQNGTALVPKFSSQIWEAGPQTMSLRITFFMWATW